MEPVSKQPHFASDEEAVDFVARMTGGRELPLEVWVRILTSSGLSLRDVERMCQVDQYFASLCASGLLWEEMFVSEFGRKLLNQRLQEMEPYRLTQDPVKHLKLILFAERIIQKRVSKWNLYYRGDGIGIVLSKSEALFTTITITQKVGGEWTDNPSIFDPLVQRIVQVIGGKYRKLGGFKMAYKWEKGFIHPAKEFVIIYTALYYGFRSTSKDVYLSECIIHPTSVAHALCGACQSVAYCSQACADADWAAHKHVCSGKINFG